VRAAFYLVTAVLVASLAIQSGSSATAPPWSVVGLQAQVPYGSPIAFAVFGPAGQQFSVSINAQPYNSSTPVFSTSYTLPGTNSIANGSSLNLSIPSTILDLGVYQISVSSTSGVPFSQQVVGIVSPVNFSSLPGELSSIWATLNATEAEYAAEGQALSNTHFDYLVAVALNFVIFGILLFVITFTRTRAAETRLGQRLRDGATHAFYTEPWLNWGWNRRPHPTPTGNPASVFVGKWFRDCPTCQTDHTEAGIRKHYSDPVTDDPETTGHGIPNPMRGVHYEASSSLRKLNTRRRAAGDPDPERVARLIDRSDVPMSIDLSDEEN
jgi:hypothetical protein